jgi:hypothetical protein
MDTRWDHYWERSVVAKSAIGRSDYRYKYIYIYIVDTPNI